MANCVVKSVNDYLTVNSDSIEDCTGFIILDKTEYLSFRGKEDFYSMPPQEELKDAFYMAFESVVVLYVACYGVMKIIQILRG
jgi:hypothetical protein